MQDYFAQLGLERRFDIDIAALEQCYFALQRQHHPDRLGMSPSGGRSGMQQSIEINQAYDTLKNPLTRARHLLALEGIDAASVQPSEAILMESMERREALEETPPGAALAALYRAIFKEREGCLGALARAFAAEDRKEAAQHTLRLGYLEKLLEEIQRKADA